MQGLSAESKTTAEEQKSAKPRNQGLSPPFASCSLPGGRETAQQKATGGHGAAAPKQQWVRGLPVMWPNSTSYQDMAIPN